MAGMIKVFFISCLKPLYFFKAMLFIKHMSNAKKRIGKHNCMYIEPEYEHKQYEYYDMRYNGYRSVDYRNLEPVNSLQQSVRQSGKRVKYYPQTAPTYIISDASAFVARVLENSILNIGSPNTASPTAHGNATTMIKRVERLICPLTASISSL